MRALKYILLIVLIFIIGSSIYIATLEANYDIKRTRTLKVPVEVIFDEINDFKNFHFSDFLSGFHQVSLDLYHFIVSATDVSKFLAGL